MAKKTSLIIVIAIAVALNVATFCLAYPHTFTPESAKVARDFSAYYIGEWRLFHNPTQVYNGTDQPGDYPIYPSPQPFKYTPSFLIFFAPFILLSYQKSLDTFDIIQAALIPILAFFVYELVKDKNLLLGAVVAVIVLIDPLPFLAFSPAAVQVLLYRFSSLNPETVSISYYWGYVLANAHILQVTLLVGALYLGYKKRPWLSALLFCLGIFDPRGAIFAFPLLIWYNRKSLVPFLSGTLAFLALTNLPFFFYYNLGFNFLRTEITGHIVSAMYPYDWIPPYAMTALTAAEAATVLRKNSADLFLRRKSKEPLLKT